MKRKRPCPPVEIEGIRRCPDCNVAPGEPHIPGCDVERYGDCGCQAISCECRGLTKRMVPILRWSGEWPGVMECRRRGMYARMDGTQGPGWHRCHKDDEGAVEDTNTLAMFHAGFISESHLADLYPQSKTQDS